MARGDFIRAAGAPSPLAARPRLLLRIGDAARPMATAARGVAFTTGVACALGLSSRAAALSLGGDGDGG